MFVRVESVSGSELDFSSGETEELESELREELHWRIAMLSWWEVERKLLEKRRFLKRIKRPIHVANYYTSAEAVSWLEAERKQALPVSVKAVSGEHKRHVFNEARVVIHRCCQGTEHATSRS